MPDPRDLGPTREYALDPINEADQTTAQQPLQAQIGTWPVAETAPSIRLGIPGYELVKEIARGGMGQVWAAFELSLQREVAIKLLLPGASSERFINESKITARLPHPSIPPVYSLGITNLGSPYLSMKLIRGETLADSLRQRSEPTHDLSHWLQVFLQITRAVGFAHSRGIIHRDLKPSNVMLGDFGEVQVMDWGLAREIGNQSLSVEVGDKIPPGTNIVSDADVEIDAELSSEAAGRDEPLPTRSFSQPYATRLEPSSDDKETQDFVQSPATTERPWPNRTPDNIANAQELTTAGTILGTPAYMAPEQARAETAGPPADVFALGGILTMILTGQPPFTGGSPIENVRLAAIGDTTEAQQRLRNCSVESTLIDIACRCLHPQADQRPADGLALSQLIESYVAGWEKRLQEVESDRLERLVRETEERKRRRIWYGASAMLTAVLVLGIVGTTIGMFQARSAATAERLALEQMEAQRNRAATAQKLAETERDEKEQSLLKEEAERRYAQAIANFVKDDFLALTSIEGQSRFGRTTSYELTPNMSLTEILNRAAVKLRQRNDLAPLIKAELCWMIGVNYRGLGYYREAIEFLQSATSIREELLGMTAPETLISKGSLAVAYTEADRFDDAVAELQTIIEVKAEQAGVSPDATWDDKLNQAIKSDFHWAVILNLAAAYAEMGRRTESARLMKEIYQQAQVNYDDEFPKMLQLRSRMAVNQGGLGQWKQALQELQLVRASQTKVLGEDHPDTLHTLSEEAQLANQMRELPTALRLSKLLVDKSEKVYGNGHPKTLAAKSILGSTWHSAGRTAEAEPMLREVLTQQENHVGEIALDTLQTRYNLSMVLIERNRPTDAIPLLEFNLQAMISILGTDHSNVISVMGQLARAQQVVGNYPESLRLHEAVYQKRLQLDGSRNPQTVTSLQNLATAYSDDKQWEKAIELTRLALDTAVGILGNDHPNVLGIKNNLAHTLTTTQQFGDAVPLFREVVAGAIVQLGPNHPHTITALHGLANALMHNGEHEEAKTTFLQTLEALVTIGFNHLYASRMLGGSVSFLNQNGAPDDAERFFRHWVAYVEQKHGPADLVALLQRCQLAKLLITQAKWIAGRDELIGALPALEQVAPDTWQFFEAQAYLGKCLFELGEADEGSETMRQAQLGLTRHQSAIPENRQSVLTDVAKWIDESEK